MFNKLKNSKKWLSKITVTFMATFMLIGLTGCSNYTYLDKAKDVSMSADGYTMKVPSDTDVKTTYNSISYTFKKSNTEYVVAVSSNKAPTSVAKYLKKDVIRGYYTYDLRNGLSKVLDISDNFTIKDNSKNATFEGYEGKEDTGSFKDANSKKYSYACYDFYADDKKLVPCEVLVASSSAKSNDLKKVAKEVIKSIKKEK